MKARFPLFLPDTIAIHHSASPRTTTYEQVERWHTAAKPEGRGWAAIGYNHVILGDGTGRPGRIVPQRGAGVANRNTGLINVLVVGDNTREDRRWTQRQVGALVLYLDACCSVWPHLRGCVFGHRDLADPHHPTLCPGLDVRELIDHGWQLEAYWDTHAPEVTE